MPAYTVRWEIDVDADTPEQAVAHAVTMMPVPGNDTTATWCDVCHEADTTLMDAQWTTINVRKEETR